ncbi:MAG: hypothetical protein WCG45_00110 [bacterium]
MKKNSFAPANLPQLFLTDNAIKFVSKLIINLEKELLHISEPEHKRVTEYRIDTCRAKLKLPRVEVLQQNKHCLPGNGIKIKFNDGKTLYLVLDGVTICEHHLPDEYAVISANSPFGRALLYLKIGGKGSFNQNSQIIKFVVEKIDPPSDAKWLFKYDQYQLSSEEKIA